MRYAVGIMAISFLLNSCIYIVGGSCKYKETVGIAKVIELRDKECTVDFYPSQKIENTQDIYNIDATCIGDISIGKSYPAIYSKEIEGSCKPYRVMVYHPKVLKSHNDLSAKFIKKEQK